MNEEGYMVIHNILTKEEVTKAKSMFMKWIHKNNLKNGILKDHSGHQQHAWYIRTNEKVQSVFKKLLNTEDIITSFDGSCYMEEDYENTSYWTHVDQNSYNTDFMCYQSFVSLTENKEKTFILVPKSHLLYEEYVKMYNIKTNKNFHIIEPDYMKDKSYVKIHVYPGTMVIWDSRIFHQNTTGNKNNEVRIVQYISFMPKYHPNNTEENKKKRKYAFENKITTTHWAYPVRFVSNPSLNTDFDVSLNEYYPKLLEILN